MACYRSERLSATLNAVFAGPVVVPAVNSRLASTSPSPFEQAILHDEKSECALPTRISFAARKSSILRALMCSL